MYIPAKSLKTSVFVLMLSVFAFGAVYFVKFQTSYRSKASSPDSPPQNVMISNPSRSSFTVSWLTLVPTTGKVFYGTDASPDKIKLVAGDDTISTVHLINLENLNPGSKYYFLICSGDNCAPFKLYGLKPGNSVLGEQIAAGISLPLTEIASPTAVISENNSNVQQGTGLPISFQTLEVSDLPGSVAIPVFGTAVLPQKNIDSILLMNIVGPNGESFPMSSTIDSVTGNFSFEASNAKKLDLSGQYPVDTDSQNTSFNLKLTAMWISNGQFNKSEKTIPMINFSPIKDAISF